jgi:uncharacterized protein with HEPN domain
MKTRIYKPFVEDMLEAMDKIERYVKGLSYEKFEKNRVLVDEVMGNLEIIDESVENIPEDVREKYPDIPWRKLIGLKSIVDLGNIWEITTKNLPEAKPKIEAMLKSLNEEE